MSIGPRERSTAPALLCLSALLLLRDGLATYSQIVRIVLHGEGRLSLFGRRPICESTHTMQAVINETISGPAQELLGHFRLRVEQLAAGKYEDITVMDCESAAAQILDKSVGFLANARAQFLTRFLSVIGRAKDVDAVWQKASELGNLRERVDLWTGRQTMQQIFELQDEVAALSTWTVAHRPSFADIRRRGAVLRSRLQLRQSCCAS